MDARLDGNAIGGLLNELFGCDMTGARVACGTCGEIEPLGAEHAYTRSPGIVMRCCHCDDVLMVVTDESSAMWSALGMRPG